MSTLMTSSRQESPGSRHEVEGQFGVLGLIKSELRRFKDDRAGDIAMLFGLMAITMMLFVGGAVDFGRWLHASKQTKNAIDAAVLAGARVLQVQGTSAAAVTAAKEAAQKYYNENVKTRLGVINDSVTFDVVNGGSSFTASGNAYIRTPILSLANISTLPLLRASGADFAEAKLAVGGNAEHSLEISLMLDVSGSMSGTKFTDMKTAAKDLIDIVVWDNQTNYTSKVAIAPFSSDVRLPSSWNAAARGTTEPLTKKLGSVTYAKTNCVAERKGTDKYTDAGPGAGKYVMTKYGSCNNTSNDVVVALTNDKTALKNSITNLDLGGGTSGHLGTAWAWYTLSPNWASVFPASSAPALNTDPASCVETPDPALCTYKLNKIAILMTDGEYNEEYTVDGVATGSSGAGSTPANASSVVQAKALCDGMKAKGLLVYTVGFDLGGNQTAINTLSYCAQDASHFYQAANGSELKQAFRDIALKISDLYLSK